MICSLNDYLGYLHVITILYSLILIHSYFYIDTTCDYIQNNLFHI